MNSDTYQTIREFVLHNQYRARLFRMKPIGESSIQITVSGIKNKGVNAVDSKASAARTNCRTAVLEMHKISVLRRE
jgi:hypothetical protein